MARRQAAVAGAWCLIGAWWYLTRHKRAELALALVDADVARWYVDDGQLSERPLHGQLSGYGRELRERRLNAVAALEATGGRDPHPLFTELPGPHLRAATRRETG